MTNSKKVMQAIVHSVIRIGQHYRQFKVSCEVAPGIGIHLIGLADQAVKESLLRTVTAIEAKGYRIPGKKVVIVIESVYGNATAFGSGFDLPIAIALLLASGQIETKYMTSSLCIIGELGLDGSIRSPYGVSGYDVYQFSKSDFSKFLMPFQLAIQTASLLPSNVYAPNDLMDAIDIITAPGTNKAEENLVWRTEEWRRIVDELTKIAEVK